MEYTTEQIEQIRNAAIDLYEALELLHEANTIIATHRGTKYLETSTGIAVVAALNKAKLNK